MADMHQFGNQTDLHLKLLQLFQYKTYQGNRQSSWHSSDSWINIKIENRPKWTETTFASFCVNIKAHWKHCKNWTCTKSGSIEIITSWPKSEIRSNLNLKKMRIRRDLHEQHLHYLVPLTFCVSTNYVLSVHTVSAYCQYVKNSHC